MPAYCTTADAKLFLGISGSADDTLLTALISAASSAIDLSINRTVLAADYTNTLNGNGRTQVVVNEGPVNSVASVTIDGQAVPMATGPTAIGYGFNRNVVWLRGRIFTRGTQNVVITYNAGWAVVPDGIKQACIETTALKYRQRDQMGFISKALAGETVTFDKNDFPESVERMLASYRKVVLPS